MGIKLVKYWGTTNVHLWLNKSSDEREPYSKLVPVFPLGAKQEVQVLNIWYWSLRLNLMKVIWGPSLSGAYIACHLAMLLADESVIDCSSCCLYISLKQLILAQWEWMSCYKWDSQNEWLHGTFNYFLLCCHQLINAGAVLLLSEDTFSVVWRG